MSKEDIRTCDTCGEQTDINVCWTDSGDYWCADECVPQWKWNQMFGEVIAHEDDLIKVQNNE